MDAIVVSPPYDLGEQLLHRARGSAQFLLRLVFLEEVKWKPTVFTPRPWFCVERTTSCAKRKRRADNGTAPYG